MRVVAEKWIGRGSKVVCQFIYFLVCVVSLCLSLSLSLYQGYSLSLTPHNTPHTHTHTHTQQGLALGLEYSKQAIETASAAAPAVVASL